MSETLVKLLLIVAAALAAIATIFVVVKRHDNEVVGQWQAKEQAVQSKMQADQRVHDQQVTDQQLESRREAKAQEAHDLVARRSNDAALERLRAIAARGGSAPAQGATAAAGGAPDAPAGFVPAGLFWGVVDQTVDLGAFARDLTAALANARRAHGECTRDYDALSP